jgi:hypothetical protein
MESNDQMPIDIEEIVERAFEQAFSRQRPSRFLGLPLLTVHKPEAPAKGSAPSLALQAFDFLMLH